MINTTDPTVSAIIITRDRLDLLRRTLLSVENSVVPVTEIVVTDDSSDDATRRMLVAEFPRAFWTKGPQRGMTANRNHGIRTASSDYILLLDDDVEMDRAFVGCALRAARRVPKGLFFPTIWEDGIPILPNGLDLLGFSTRIYAPGERYHTANCQCILMPRALALEEPWDEVISGYGYEEMDYGYRIAAQGHPLIALPQCVCTHLAPNVNRRFRIGPDANRLYVAMKRHFLIDRNLTRGLAFLALGLPHHVLARVKRNGLRGIGEAFSNFRLATSLIRRHIRDAA